MRAFKYLTLSKLPHEIRRNRASWWQAHFVSHQKQSNKGKYLFFVFLT